MIDARIIANFVLDRADDRGREVTNLDLQKIVYFLHGHYIHRTHIPLVEGEFEAWTYGPVHRTIYDAFKSYNDTPIDGRATAFNPIKRQQRKLPPLVDRDTIALIDDVLCYYLDMPTYSLVQLTHNESTPWSRTVRDAEEHINVGMKISNSLIKECFEGSADIPKREMA